MSMSQDFARARQALEALEKFCKENPEYVSTTLVADDILYIADELESIKVSHVSP